jgi:hypothetical protein
MANFNPTSSTPLRVLSITVVVIGIATFSIGFDLLFIQGTFTKMINDYLHFVVWFNFFSGIVYLIAGYGIWHLKPWAVYLSLLIVVFSLIVLTALSVHMFTDGQFRGWQIAEMGLKVLIWSLILMSISKKFRLKGWI